VAQNTTPATQTLSSMTKDTTDVLQYEYKYNWR